jgi:signal transduction histidine kinase
MAPSAKKLFGFQAKVLFPVVSVLIFLLATIMWLVNRRLVDELQEEARQNLTIAEAVFRNSFDIRSRNLLLRYELLVNEPRFRAVAQLAEPKTMTVQLKELLDETGPDAKVMIFTMDKNMFLAGVRSEPEINLEKFRLQAFDLINLAHDGKAGTGTIAVGDHLFTIISVPVVAENNLAGVLTIGVNMGTTAAQELKSLTRSEVVFVANNTVAASTFSNTAFYPKLISIYKTLSIAPATGPAISKEVIAPDGEHFLCVARELTPSGPSVGYLLLSSYESALLKSAATQRTLIVLSLIGILFSSLLIWAFIRKATRPLRELRKSAEAVGAGDFSQRVAVQSSDELGELATVFNRMTENLTLSRETLKNTQAQLVQSEKLSAIGEFVAGVAHELNNPLTGVIGFSEMLQESGISEQQNAYLVRIVDCAERCHKIVQSLLSFSRRRLLEREMISVNELIESTIDFVGHELKQSNVEVITNFSSAIPPFPLDPHQIEQVFINIINNARQAIQKKGQKGVIRISTELVDGRVRVRFEDNGSGIAPDHLGKIFNPFFTTKRVGEGTGLGLSLSYGIIREHGGSISAESVLGQGTTLTVELPVGKMEDAAPEFDAGSIQTPTARVNGRRKILVIDDEESILDLIQGALSTRGHQVEIVTDGNKGIQRISNNHYDLIICDWKIPGMEGQEVYKEAEKMNSANVERFLFITGNVLSPETEHFLRAGRRSYLLKPFSIEQLRAAVDQLLA